MAVQWLCFYRDCLRRKIHRWDCRDLKREGYIENCYNRGKVKSETHGSGGIVEYTAGGKIRNCYNAGSDGEPILSSPYPFENSYYDTKNYRDPYYCPPEGKTTRFMNSPAFVKCLITES